MFSSRRKISIRKQLYDDLAVAAREAGYASTEELIVHVLEREVDSRQNERDRETVDQQLRGLGYLE